MKTQYLVLLFVSCVSARVVEEMEIGDGEGVNDGLPDFVDIESSTEIAEATEDVPGTDSWSSNDKIAFSAYLSTPKCLGKGQHIKFDKVLLNDGDGYEATTGVFRAKVDGVYMFTYVIAQRHHRELRARLMYNGKVVNGAIAEGQHRRHDVQGTNTAIIHVCKGKAVWVEATDKGHLEGNNGDNRFSTFSGFLVYARR